MTSHNEPPLNNSNPQGLEGSNAASQEIPQMKGSENSPEDDTPARSSRDGVISGSDRKPIEAVLYECRRTFYLAFMITAVVDLLSIAPMLYMMNVFDRVVTTRSGVTLVSLTVLVLAVYVFWSAIEWIRSRLLVRLSLRIDWDLSADIFDASFRRFAGGADPVAGVPSRSSEHDCPFLEGNLRRRTRAVGRIRR